MKLVCLGDSLTYGYGVPRKDIWTRLTAEATGHEVLNRGINGDTTGGMLARLRSDALAEKPDAVLLMGGANDLICSGSDSGARANMAAMVQQLVAAGRRPVVGLYLPIRPAMVPPPWTDLADFEALMPLFEDYRRWLLRFAGVFGLATVDFAPGFTGADGTSLYLDGLHPSAAGHRRMADLLCAALPPRTGGTAP